MSKRKNDKLFKSLSKYYIILIFIITIIFILSYFVIALLVNRFLDNKSISFINAITSNKADFKEIDSDELKSIGAYIQILDGNGNVIQNIGEPQNTIIKTYSKQELLNEVVSSKKDGKYLTLVNKIKYQDKDCFAVISIPKDSVSISINFMNIPMKISRPVFNIYCCVVVLAIILVVFSIIIYSIYTTKRLKYPLDNINTALEKITDGNYNEKVSESGVLEFDKISNTINYLTEKLKSSNDENKRLQQSRNRMLLDLSHDIRTPITSIKGFSQALYEGMINDEETKLRYYKTIYLKSERVSELVDDLFELVRMDKIQYILKLESVDICEYIRQIILAYYDEIEYKGFELEVNIPDNPIMLRIDIKLYKRVIVNLIENSLKYNPKGTKLRIEIRDTNKFVVIEIADNGIGIEDEVRDKVFDAFVRADKSRKSTGGSGLGLAIAKKIVENHGGEILLLNPRADEKTIFYIKMFKEF